MTTNPQGHAAASAASHGRGTRPFSARAMLAVTAALSGAALPATGLALHAHRSRESAAEAAAWTAVHVALGVLFGVAAAWHGGLNRRALRAHMRGTAAEPASITREALCAVAAVAAVALAAAAHSLAGS